MVSRRRFLQLGGTSGLAILTGCSRFQNNETKPLRVSVTNVTDESHTVALSVFDDSDELLVEQQVEIARAEPNNGTEIHTIAWIKSYPQTATFQVQSTLDDNDTSTNSVTIDCGSEFDGGNVIVRIHENSRMSISESCF